ncbi:hypothetical protein WN51_03403 [Melipona quadrifasciata]|uniref:Uncharacterized protein n=1 Tax=Melipona quadrifasciata TaxID=166423 RepID=A0A0N0BEC0_9HYME|nr:hypothetical protein WN51_03403 [Melipona quadrifasciata]
MFGVTEIPASMILATKWRRWSLASTFARDQKLVGGNVFGNHNITNAPTFEMNVPRNVTTAVGQTAFLHCRVHQLGDKEPKRKEKQITHYGFGYFMENYMINKNVYVNIIDTAFSRSKVNVKQDLRGNYSLIGGKDCHSDYRLTANRSRGPPFKGKSPSTAVGTFRHSTRAVRCPGLTNSFCIITLRVMPMVGEVSITDECLSYCSKTYDLFQQLGYFIHTNAAAIINQMLTKSNQMLESHEVANREPEPESKPDSFAVEFIAALQIKITSENDRQINKIRKQKASSSRNGFKAFEEMRFARRLKLNHFSPINPIFKQFDSLLVLTSSGHYGRPLINQRERCIVSRANGILVTDRENSIGLWCYVTEKLGKIQGTLGGVASCVFIHSEVYFVLRDKDC